MNRCIGLIVMAWAATVCGFLSAEGEKGPAKIRVLLVTGGHAFDAPAFYAVFDGIPGIEYTKADIIKESGVFKPGIEKQYDVVVRYDMAGKITPEDQKAWLGLLDAGVGVVALHHCLGSHSDWPDYAKSIGGAYVFKEFEADGKKIGKSNYSHDQDVRVTVVDKAHPITKGVEDFSIHDEVYGNCYVAPGVHVLLKTDHPKSTPELSWTTKAGKSPVAYLMLGHDAKAYQNPAFKKLIENSIRWAAENRPR